MTEEKPDGSMRLRVPVRIDRSRFFFSTTPKGNRWVQNGKLGLDNKTCPPKSKRYNWVKTHNSCETSTRKQKGTHTDGMRWRIVSCIANTNKSMTPYHRLCDGRLICSPEQDGGRADRLTVFFISLRLTNTRWRRQGSIPNDFRLFAFQWGCALWQKHSN